jgi:hypothetical protein
MSHGPNRYRAERRQAEAAAERAAADPRAVERAQRIVAVWNVRAGRGRPAEFFPTFETALTAGCWRLTYCCPACRQMATIDIRDFAHAHHVRAPISMLVPKLSCERCCPNPPLAVLLELEGLAAALPIAEAPPGWVWLHCENCRHKRPAAIVPFVIRWDAETPSDRLRRSMRCTKCGHKGALTYHPTWIDMNARW